MMTLFTCIPVPLPKKYSGKVYIGNIDKEYFTLIEQTDEHTLYSGIVYPKNLKCNIWLAYVIYRTGTTANKPSSFITAPRWN
jgi:hypothetical protein